MYLTSSGIVGHALELDESCHGFRPSTIEDKHLDMPYNPWDPKGGPCRALAGFVPATYPLYVGVSIPIAIEGSIDFPKAASCRIGVASSTHDAVFTTSVLPYHTVWCSHNVDIWVAHNATKITTRNVRHGELPTGVPTGLPWLSPALAVTWAMRKPHQNSESGGVSVSVHLSCHDL